MIGYLRNWMKKQKKDNRGAAMILVIVSIAFIGCLLYTSPSPRDTR